MVLIQLMNDVGNLSTVLTTMMTIEKMTMMTMMTMKMMMKMTMKMKN
tara:strand:- start:106 stop:246 length:141 start_codon:yes stop_codon:yes gene_type:complete